MDRLLVSLWLACLLCGSLSAQTPPIPSRPADTTTGDILNPEPGTASDPLYQISTAWARRRPTLDGVVDINVGGEGWDQFAWGPIDVSRLQNGTVLAWYLNDCTHLYIGLIDFNLVSPSSHEIGIYFDDASATDTVGLLDDQWSGTCEGPPHTTAAAEGNFWISQSLKNAGGDIFRQWSSSAPSSAVCGSFPHEQPAAGLVSVHGVTSGRASLEVRIDLRDNASALNAEPGDVLNYRQYVFDKLSSTNFGLYPPTAVFDDPSTYAIMTLDTPPSSRCGSGLAGVNLAGDPSLTIEGAQFAGCGFDASEIGNFGLVVLSISGTAGIPLPGSGGCQIPLTADIFTTLGLGLQVLFSGTVQGPGTDRILQTLETPLLAAGSLTVPVFTLYASSVTLDTAGGIWGSVSPATTILIGGL